MSDYADRVAKYTKSLDRNIAQTVGTLWEQYCIKFHRASELGNNDQALIKMYSNYKALKIIGNVCKEILQITHNGTSPLNQDQIEEFEGALDVAQLSKEQKKFELRAKNNKFGNEEGEVRIAEIIGAHRTMGINKRADPVYYFANTPFGQIKIECKFMENDKETRMISVRGKDGTEYSYKTMIRNIDFKLWTLKISTRKQILNSIKKYINQKCDLEDIDAYNAQQILNSIKPFEFQGKRLLDESSLDALSVLCGCLLFAESSEVRNPTRGKWEKKSIEKVEKILLANEECLNPFGVVFCGDKSLGFLDEAYGGYEIPIKAAAYTPARSNDGTLPLKPTDKGGMVLGHWLITGKVNINEDFSGYLGKLFKNAYILEQSIESVKDAIGEKDQIYKTISNSSQEDDFTKISDRDQDYFTQKRNSGIWASCFKNLFNENFFKIINKDYDYDTLSKWSGNCKSTIKNCQTKETLKLKDEVFDKVCKMYELVSDLLNPNNNSNEDVKKYWEFFLAAKKKFNTLNKAIPIDALPDDGAGKDIKSKIKSLISKERKALHELNN